MRPAFEVTPRSARLLSEIERRVGRHEGALRAPVSPMLRRSLRVRTIQASLQIEGNTLTEEQVTAVLGQCDAAGNSTAFIEFALELTLEALKHVVMARQPRMTSPMRIEAARHHFAKASFTRKDYLGHFPGLSPATASRDLQAAVSNRLLQREGDKATAKYRFDF